MATVINLSKSQTIDTSFDGVIVEKVLSTVHQGATLDTTGYAKSVIPEGTPIVYNAGVYAIAAADDSDAANAVGVTIGSVLTEKPLVAILDIGKVNEKAYLEATGETYSDALKAALPHIKFV